MDMRFPVIACNILLAIAVSGWPSPAVLAQTTGGNSPSETAPVIVIYPAPERPPAPPTPGERPPSFWHRLDVRAAGWRDRLSQARYDFYVFLEDAATGAANVLCIVGMFCPR
jgi:hypothetical protein